MITIIIVENESIYVHALQRDIYSYYPNFKIVCTCATYEEAVESIQYYKPDLVFMDIELDSVKSGVDVLKDTRHLKYEIIFTTAHNEYLESVIKFSFIDYLLKPYTTQSFQKAITSYQEKAGSHTELRQEVFVRNISQPEQRYMQIGIPTVEGYEFILLTDIIYCEASDNYTYFILGKGTKISSSKTMKYFEDFLSKYDFFRIHKSYIINYTHVRKYLKGLGEGGDVVLSNQQQLPVSRAKKQLFLEFLSTRGIQLS